MQLVQLRAATQKQVAAAFGTDPVTVWRWDRALRESGVAGLIPARKGPRAAWKLTPDLAGRIRELDASGMGLAAIAGECGVSTFTVRTALGRVAAAGLPDEEEASTAGEDPAGAEPDAGEEPGGGEVLPVLPDSVAREPERALARFGLLGEGAAPLFTPGARYPLAGLLLALPALEETGLLACARTVYGRMRNGFYGLPGMPILLVFLALLREPRAEGATRIDPGALGRVLGLDRAPEVKTIRRSLSEILCGGVVDRSVSAGHRRWPEPRGGQDDHARECGGRSRGPGGGSSAGGPGPG